MVDHKSLSHPKDRHPIRIWLEKRHRRENLLCEIDLPQQSYLKSFLDESDLWTLLMLGKNKYLEEK